eukprot:Trichotokara_eunicae@DN5272_c0_g1_i5.p1
MLVKQPDDATTDFPDFVISGCGMDFSYTDGIMSSGTADFAKLGFAGFDEADDVLRVDREALGLTFNVLDAGTTIPFYALGVEVDPSAECTHFMVQSDTPIEISFMSYLGLPEFRPSTSTEGGDSTAEEVTDDGGPVDPTGDLPDGTGGDDTDGDGTGGDGPGAGTGEDTDDGGSEGRGHELSVLVAACLAYLLA